MATGMTTHRTTKWDDSQRHRQRQGPGQGDPNPVPWERQVAPATCVANRRYRDGLARSERSPADVATTAVSDPAVGDPTVGMLPMSSVLTGGTEADWRT